MFLLMSSKAKNFRELFTETEAEAAGGGGGRIYLALFS